MDFESAVTAYIKSLANSASSTRRTTRSALRQFSIALDKRPGLTDAAQLSVSDAERFAEHLAESNHAPACVRTYLSHVNGFYHFMLRKQIMSLPQHEVENMAYFMKHNLPRSSRLPISTDYELTTRLIEAARALNVVDLKASKRGDRLSLIRLRDIALLEVLRSTGMRVGEIVALRQSNLIQKSHTARVTGKGDKQRIVYFDEPAWSTLKSYHAMRSKKMEPTLLGAPVFVRHDRQAGAHLLPLSTNAVRVIFTQLAQSAGIDEWIHPHGLRHAFAERVLAKTGNLAVVQDLLGHASPETTRIYAKTTAPQLAEAHRKAFGGNGQSDED